MNWRIRRVRLEAVGPPDARYDDITLSFVAAGRAAPNAVVLLRNGGGKSLLLFLIFKALLPRRADGTKTAGDQREARPIVAPDECATVAIEWQHCDDDRLLVTGHSFERGEGTDVRWMFEPREGSLTLEDLPLRDGARRRTRAGLMLALAARGRADPRLRWRDETGVSAWEQGLSQEGLDPAILRYQARLNRREGGDDDELRFRSPQEFARLVLRMVLDDEPLARLQTQVATHAAQLAQKDAKGAEAEFCRDIAVLLQALGSAHDELTAADNARRAAQELWGIVAGVLRAAREDGADRAATLERSREPLEARRQSLETHVRDLRRETSVVGAGTAKLRADAARAELASAIERVAAGDGEHAAWLLAESIADLQGAEGRRGALAAQLSAQEAGLSDAQRDRAAAAVRLAAALFHEAMQVDSRAGQVRGAWTAAEDNERRLASAIGDLNGRRGDAKERRGRLEAVLDLFERATERLRDCGLLGRQERPSAAIARFQADLDDCAEREVELADRTAELRDRHQTTAAALALEHDTTSAQQAALDELDARRGTALARVRDALVDAVRDTLDVGRDWQPLEEPAAAEQALEHARAAADARAAVAENQIDALTADERSLTEHQLLSIEADIEHACDVLDRCGVHAFAAMRYLADAVAPESRRAVIAAHPILAAGIVVIDVDPHTAVTLLCENGARPPRRPLIVAAAADLQHGESAASTAVVLPADAAYDQQAAEAATAEIASRLAVLRHERDEHRSLSTQLAHAALVLFDQTRLLHAILPAASRNDRRLLSTVEHHCGALSQSRDAAAQRLATQEAALVEVDRSLVAVAVEQAGLEREQQRARGALDRLDHLDDVDVIATRAALEDLATLAATLTGQAATLGDERDTVIRATQRLGNEFETLNAQASNLRGRALGLPTDGAAVTPEPGELPMLTAALKVAEDAVRESIPDETLRARLAAAEENTAALRSKQGLAPEAVRARATRLAGTSVGVDRDALDRGCRDAKAAHESAIERKGQADSALSLATRAYEEAHSAVAADDYARAPKVLRSLNPTNIGEGEAWLAQLAALKAVAEREAINNQEELANADQLLARERDLLRELDDAAGRLLIEHPPKHVAALPAWTRRTDGIRERVSTAVTGLEIATRFLTAAREVLTQRLHAVTERTAAADARIPPGVLAPLRGGETLAADAVRYEAELRTRAGELDRQIAELDKHRDAIVAQLLTIGTEGVRKLDRVAAATRLPHEPALGAWSGKQFARLTHKVVTDEATRRHLLREVLNRAVTSGSSRRGGPDLAFEATMALFEDGLRVFALKPHPQPDDQYHPIEKVGPEFSGGEELTIKLVLFCAVSAVRAAERAGRPRGGYRAGPLLIDNPIGTASRGSLVDLQLRLARHLGAQFIPFTALEGELNVTGRFAAVVALTNDQDLLSGQRYVTPADTVVVPPRPPDTPSGASLVSTVTYTPAVDVARLADEARGR